jgi:hypothetical protein
MALSEMTAPALDAGCRFCREVDLPSIHFCRHFHYTNAVNIRVNIALLNIHLQSQLTVLLTYSSLFHSQLVLAPSGHPQVNHNMLYYI